LNISLVISLAQYVFVTLIFGAILALAGSSIISNKVTISLAERSAVGVAVVVATLTAWGYSGRSNQLFSYAICAIGFVRLIAICRGGLVSRKNLTTAGGHLSLFTAGVFASLAPYLSVFKSGVLKNSIVPFSNTNNDLASYLLGADNLSRTGFAETGRAESLGIGALSKFEFPGSSSIYSFLSHFTTLDVWRIGIPVITVLSALTFMLLIDLQRLLGIHNKVIQFLIALWAMNSSLGVTIQNNYFLSQALARLFTVGLLVVATRYVISKESSDVSSHKSFVLFTAAMLISYAAGSSLYLLSVFLWVLLLAISRKNKSQVVKHLIMFSLSIAGGFILVFPRWQLIVENFQFFARANITGWPAPTLRPYILLGVGNHFFFTRNVLTVSLFSSLTLIFVFLLFKARVRLPRQAIAALVTSCSLFLMFAVLVFSVGSTTYQTWKFLASVQCLIIIFSMVAVYSSLLHTGVGSKSKKQFLLGLLLSVIAYSTVLSGQDTFRDMTVVPTKDLVTASHSPKIHSIANLTISLRPYLETMMAPVILDIYGARFGSDTYLGAPGPLSGCLLRYRPEWPDEKEVLETFGSLELVDAGGCKTK
jgi:hypothetical protein